MLIFFTPNESFQEVTDSMNDGLGLLGLSGMWVGRSSVDVFKKTKFVLLSRSVPNAFGKIGERIFSLRPVAFMTETPSASQALSHHFNECRGSEEALGNRLFSHKTLIVYHFNFLSFHGPRARLRSSRLILIEWRGIDWSLNVLCSLRVKSWLIQCGCYVWP